MAEQMDTAPTADGGATSPPQQAAPHSTVGLTLTAGDHGSEPIVSNCTAVHVSPGFAFLDFGFIEPALLDALARTARAGKRVPSTVEGKLAARIAVGYDALRNLHVQIESVLRPTGRKANASNRNQKA